MEGTKCDEQDWVGKQNTVKAGGKGSERQGGKEGERKRQKERRAPHGSEWQSAVESKQGSSLSFAFPCLCHTAVSLRLHLGEGWAHPAAPLLLAGLGAGLNSGRSAALLRLPGSMACQ